MTDRRYISHYLDQIEEEYDVTVLAARDHGSHAWGLEDEDSDYDVAVVFSQPLEDYAGLSTYTETIDRSFEDGRIEFMAWNIRKFFTLLSDTNPSTTEFLMSSILYRQKNDKAWIELEEYVAQNFSPVSLYYHYREMAKKQYKRYLEDENKPTVKKHLYVIRALLYAEFIEEFHDLPTLNFEKFLQSVKHLDEIDQEKVDWGLRLKDRKKSGDNGYIEDVPHEMIQDAVQRQIDPEKHNSQDLDDSRLNEYLQRLIKNRKIN